jgi:hypothetical protein
LSPEEIEKALAVTAQQLGVSIAKLKAIYARGIKECIKEGYPEAPYVHGLTRVQHFARAMSSDYHTLDGDFLPRSRQKYVPPTLNDTEALIFYEDTGSFTACGEDWVCELIPSKGSWTIYAVE